MTTVTASDNKKGGTGKTTTAFNYGTLLAAQGHRVMIVDLDSDRCLTDGIGGGTFDAHRAGKLSILDCLANPADGFTGAAIPYDIAPFMNAAQRVLALVGMSPKAGGKLDLIAGSEDLSEAPRLFTDARMRQPVATFEQSLHWMVRQPSVTSQYDDVILDIGTGWDIVTKSGLFAADRAIIPVEPASLSIEAFKRHNIRIIRGNSERTKAGLPGQTQIAGVLISRVSMHSQVQLDFANGMRQMLAGGSIPCFKTMIPASDAILIAMKDHVPAWGAYPDDPGAQAFAHLVSELKG